MAFRATRGSRSRTSEALSHPSASRQRAFAGPILQISATDTRMIQWSYCSGSVRSQTPPNSGFFFVKWFASFARLFVEPMPTQVGLPV
jgi:hypothetical protein